MGSKALHQLWKQKMVLKINQLVFHSVQKVYSRSYVFNLQPNLLPTLSGLLIGQTGIVIPFNRNSLTMENLSKGSRSDLELTPFELISSENW